MDGVVDAVSAEAQYVPPGNASPSARVAVAVAIGSRNAMLAMPEPTVMRRVADSSSHAWPTVSRPNASPNQIAP